jgi:hypothetical protein
MKRSRPITPLRARRIKCRLPEKQQAAFQERQTKQAATPPRRTAS